VRWTVAGLRPTRRKVQPETDIVCTAEPHMAVTLVGWLGYSWQQWGSESWILARGYCIVVIHAANRDERSQCDLKVESGLCLKTTSVPIASDSTMDWRRSRTMNADNLAWILLFCWTRISRIERIAAKLNKLPNTKSTDWHQQRLHRRPGAGKSHSIGDGGRMIVGDTYLPPDFFQNKPDIVIVGSHDSRH
jgi:hypothetical protein